MDDIKVTVTYKNKDYKFDYGSQAYIFHTGIYNDMDKKYSVKQLLQYVALVNNCYLSDSNRTPLGELCDYVAKHWKRIKSMGRYDILDEFYDYIGL